MIWKYELDQPQKPKKIPTGEMKAELTGELSQGPSIREEWAKMNLRRSHPEKRHKTPLAKSTSTQPNTATVGDRFREVYCLPSSIWGPGYETLSPQRLTLRRATNGQLEERVVFHSDNP